MHPELEFFLEDALKSIQRTSPEIGRVVFEPDYDIDPIPTEARQVGDELKRCLAEQTPQPDALAAHDGFPVALSGKYPLLSKYARAITLHADGVEGPWVEIAPPGNWI